MTELLELIQMTGRGRSPVTTLSGGQQQRVALARALAISPRVLLMDEPLGALDARLREAMQLELAAVQRRLGITTILVTHDQQEAMVLADRIVVMANGRIQQTGTAEQLYHQPRNRFVAEFLGSNNVLAGRVDNVGAQGSKVLLRGGSALWVPTRRAGCTLSGNRGRCHSRPQHVGVTAMRTEADPGLCGQIEERRFFGNRVNYSVRLNSGEHVIAECAASSSLFQPGTRVALNFPADHIHLFDSAGRTLHGE